MYRFESATDKANDDFPAWEESKLSSTSGYQKLKTIAAQERFEMDDPNKASHTSTETISFKPTQPGFYIAFKTSKTCMSLQRVRIFYYNCQGTSQLFLSVSSALVLIGIGESCSSFFMILIV